MHVAAENIASYRQLLRGTTTACSSVVPYDFIIVGVLWKFQNTLRGPRWASRERCAKKKCFKEE